MAAGKWNVEAYVSSLWRWRRFVLAFWVMIVLLGLVFGPKFLKATKLEITAPKGSKASLAQQEFDKEFPQQAGARLVPTILLVESRDGRTKVVNKKVRQVVRGLEDSVKKYSYEHNATVRFASYFEIVILGGEKLAEEFLNDNGTAMIVEIVFNATQVSDSGQTFISWLDSKVKTLPDEIDDEIKKEFNFGLTGPLVFARDVQHATASDLAKMDGLSFPLALLVLASMLRSFRLLVIPVINIIITALGSLLIMYPIALRFSVIGLAPSVMISSCVAFSIDYSLFLLTRFKQELKIPGTTVEHAVNIMVRSAGHTIFVSGLTLAICWFGLIVFPIMLISTLGVAAGVTILVALATNLTLTPTLLLTFPGFFGSTNRCCCSCIDTRLSAMDEELLLTTEEQQEMLRAEPKTPKEELDDMSSNLWLRLALATMGSRRSACLMVLLLIACWIPLAPYAFKFSRSNSFHLMIPRHTEADRTLERLESDFGAGRLTMYKLLIQTGEDQSVRSDKIFDDTIDLAQNILSKDEALDANKIMGVPFAFGHPVPYSNHSKFYQWGHLTFEECQKHPIVLLFPCRPILALEALQMSKHATFLTLVLNIEPVSVEGNLWLDRTRKILEERSQKNGLNYSLVGIGAIQKDAIDAVYEIFPVAIIITSVVVVVLLGISFRSFLIPLRAALSIGITISFVFGLTKLVYEDGILDFLGVPGLANMHHVNWIGPVLNFFVLIGLGLDYEAFLSFRIMEYRARGFTTSQSVYAGLAKTGTIISAAGCIMFIAFAGLLFSSTPALNQLAFYLVAAVLLETLIIRTIFVPSSTIVLDELNWFPQRFPAPMERDGGYDVLHNEQE